ncbi:MAG: hypothetical protein V3V62_10635 [bacterium]
MDILVGLISTVVGTILVYGFIRKKGVKAAVPAPRVKRKIGWGGKRLVSSAVR